MAKISENKNTTLMPEMDVNTITQALAAPFNRDEVHWKPQTVSGNRALVVAFVDARVIQDRLDDVLGVMGWQDSYECLPDGSVVCRLKVKIGQEWITKEDVGGQSEQPDEGDRRKAAFSDALKRAAVKFGIGRYLYRQKPQWMDYDPQKRRIVGTPVLASPEEKPGVGGLGTGAKTEDRPPSSPQSSTSNPQPRTKSSSPQSPAPRKGLPQNGEELRQRLYEKDKKLAETGMCQEGELVKFVVEAGVKEGLEKDLTAWSGAAIQLAVDQVKAFEALRTAPPKKVA